MAAVLDYICTEIFDPASTFCEKEGRVQLKPRHIAQAVRGDAEMSKLWASVQISEGGQKEFIHEALWTKEMKKKATADGASSQ